MKFARVKFTTHWGRNLRLGERPSVTNFGIQDSILCWVPPNPPLTTPTLPFRGQNVILSLRSKSLLFENYRGKS